MGLKVPCWHSIDLVVCTYDRSGAILAQEWKGNDVLHTTVSDRDSLLDWAGARAALVPAVREWAGLAQDRLLRDQAA